jgi:hypothetical protein
VPALLPPPYLAPYADAARQFGGGFSSLLWASPRTQRARFDAICRIEDLDGRVLLDAGCGRSDMLDHLAARAIHLARYIGIEAIAELADAAREKRYPNASVHFADFVSDPSVLDAGADVVIFSGSLNTLSPERFYATIRHGFAAAGGSLVFNFLCSPLLAGRDYLHWHNPSDVLAFCRTLSNDIGRLTDYLEGDCTFSLRKRSST